MSEIPNGGAEGNQHDRWINLKKQMIIIPYDFINTVQNSADLFLESINAYVYGLPNSSVIQAVRCGELALRKYLETNGVKQISVKKGETQVTINTEDAHFYDLIEANESALYDKDEMHYFRALHNKMHRNELLNDLDALSVLDKVTKQINHLFPFGLVTLPVKCPYRFCGNVAPINIPFDSYFIGNEAKLTCTSEKHNAILPRRNVRVKLDGINYFTVEEA